MKLGLRSPRRANASAKDETALPRAGARASSTIRRAVVVDEFAGLDRLDRPELDEEDTDAPLAPKAA
jgi:hypothetical protein